MVAEPREPGVKTTWQELQRVMDVATALWSMREGHGGFVYNDMVLTSQHRYYGIDYYCWLLDFSRGNRMKRTLCL